MVTLLVGILTFLGGLWSAAYLQDRQMRRRHVGIVRALRAELSRVSSEAAFSSDGFSPRTLSGSTYVVPQLAPWALDLAIELASGDADHLRGLMDLERHLHNLRASSKDAVSAGAHLDRMAAQLEYQKKQHPEDLHAQIEAESWLRKAEDAANLAFFKAQKDLEYARQRHAEMMTALNDYEPRLERALRLGLPVVPRAPRDTA